MARARYYGQVEGKAQTRATREGSAASGLRVSCQTDNGSVIITATAFDKVDRFRVFFAPDSNIYGELAWEGTLDEMREVFRRAGNEA